MRHIENSQLFINLIWLQNKFSLREFRNLSMLSRHFGHDIRAKESQQTSVPVLWLDHSATLEISTDSLLKNFFKLIKTDSQAKNRGLFSTIVSKVVPKVPPQFQRFVRWIEIKDVQSEEWSYVLCFIYEEIRIIFRDYQNICNKIESHFFKRKDYRYFPQAIYPMVQLASCYFKILILKYFSGFYIDTGDVIEDVKRLPNLSEIPHPNILTTGYSGDTLKRHEDWLIFTYTQRDFINELLGRLNIDAKQFYPNFDFEVSEIKALTHKRLLESIQIGEIYKSLSREEDLTNLWKGWVTTQFDLENIQTKLNQVMANNFFVFFTRIVQKYIPQPHTLLAFNLSFMENITYFTACFGTLPFDQDTFSFSSPGFGSLLYFKWLIDNVRNPVLTREFMQAIEISLFTNFKVRYL